MPIVVDPNTPIAFVVPDVAAVVVDGVVRIDLGAAVSGVTTNDTENLSTLTPSPGPLTDALDGVDAQADATAALGAISTLDTSGVGNVSTVTGATATLALDDLNARIAALEALIAALPNMQSVFQDPIAVSTSPVLQIDGIYGLLDTDNLSWMER